jgi:YcaO-like protein with predicted kinase domain
MTATVGLWDTVLAEDGDIGYGLGTFRAVPPEETLDRVRPLLSRAGITRVADITRLDWIGLPVYQAIRPNSRNLSVSQGKGLTPSLAQVSAMMESFESYHAEEINQPATFATVAEMRREIDYDPYALPVVKKTASLPRELDYDPYALPVGRPCVLSDAAVVDWIAATDLVTGKASWVPRQLCELNYCVEQRISVPLFRASSNGLASGNTVIEALIHGLCEVVERDALWRCARALPSPTRCIDPSTVSSDSAQDVIVRFQRAGMRTRIVDMTGPTGLPSFEVLINHPESASHYLGWGCHPDRATALLRALTESAQSRLAHIAGSRDDLRRRSYLTDESTASISRQALSDDEHHGQFESAPTIPLTDFKSALRDLVARVLSVTGMSPLAVDLRRPEFGLPVAIVIAPGLRIDPPRRG